MLTTINACKAHVLLFPSTDEEDRKRSTVELWQESKALSIFANLHKLGVFSFNTFVLHFDIAFFFFFWTR